MLIKFKGVTHANYVGVDTTGKMLDMKQGDEVEVSDDTALILLRRYSRDFERVLPAARPTHAPQVDKELRKSKKFQAK